MGVYACLDGQGIMLKKFDVALAFRYLIKVIEGRDCSLFTDITWGVNNSSIKNF